MLVGQNLKTQKILSINSQIPKWKKKIVAIKKKDNVVNTEKIVTETAVIPLVIVLLIAQTLQSLFLTDFPKLK